MPGGDQANNVLHLLLTQVQYILKFYVKVITRYVVYTIIIIIVSCGKNVIMTILLSGKCITGTFFQC